METLKLEFHPSQAALNSFLVELKKEYEQNGCGIYCNWDIVKDFFKKDKIIILTLNNKPISFVTWQRNDKIISLDIIWSLPQYRGKGLGYKFQQLLFKEFKKRGDVAIEVNCATKEGLSMAKRNGFIPKTLSANFNNDIDLKKYPSYIKILKNTDFLFLNNEDLIIKCYEEYNDENSLYCTINLNADFINKPVYFYINCDWECKVLHNGSIIHQNKMKYIIKDLGITLYDYTIACIDHNIIIPQHWLR